MVCSLCSSQSEQTISGGLAHLYAQLGQTTADGLFTLQQSECLGACADAPVMLVNDRNMCSNMSNERLDQMVEALREKAKAAQVASKGAQS